MEPLPAPHAVASLEGLRDHARAALGDLGSEVVAARTLPARPGRFEPLPDDLSGALRAALAEAGIERLFTHQADAWRATRDGRDLLLTTGTSSGKSLAFQAPIVADQTADATATALVLTPTKALAYDQAERFARFAGAAGLPPSSVATYDGDTPTSRRRTVRASVRTLLTNPDMLHAGILPHHTRWRRWLAGLRWIVVDEVHVYRGVFGGHVAGVLRRLERVARHYGARPRVIATSATLGNPVAHARTVLGREVTHLDVDAAPHGPREVMLVRPPLLDEDLGLRRPALAEAASLARRLADRGLQVLVFAGSRQGAEEAVVQLRGVRRGPKADTAGAGDATAAAAGDGVRAYRSGLLASERRTIERELRDGSARIVVATNALELGIDIGGVDAVVVAGYPGSAAGFWQQLGRAGRAGRPALGLLVLGAGPLDQYLARHPEHLFGASPERALADPDHLLLTLDHLRCATFELPLDPSEGFGGFTAEELAVLGEQIADDGEAYAADGRFYWVGARYPAEAVSLRSAGRDDVTLLRDDGVAIGTVDGPSARWMVHPGAIYLHDGAPHRVDALDLEARVARLTPTGDEVLTRATRETRIDPAGTLEARPAAGCRVLAGDVTVTERVTGYRRLRRATRETLGRFPLDLPPVTLFTRAYAFVPDEAVVGRLRDGGAWSNDANDYGPAWPRARAAAIRRDEGACRVCGDTASHGTALHVHHRIPFRSFARAAEANRLDNLVTLCPSCHSRAEREVRVRSGLAAVAHVVRAVAPLRVLCDARDLGVVAEAASSLADGGPALVVYETVPGGVGLADELAAAHEALVTAAREIVTSCPCQDGCPACVGPAGEEGHGGKREARALLQAITA